MRVTLIIALLVVGIIAGCSDKKADIIGTWQRLSDDFAGMQVTVEALDDGTYRGTIVRPDDAGYFTKGDVKWLDIKRIKAGSYDISDIGTEAEAYNCTLTINDDGTIEIRELVESKDDTVGSKQIWKRVG